MFHNKSFLLALLLTGCTLICAASQIDVNLGKADLAAVVKGLPEELEKKTTTTTTLAPQTSTTTSTTTPSTTSTSTTTTTTSTTTTTVAPPPAPITTTTAAPDTTTTAAPITTTTAAPITTTPAPAPYPEPSIGTWNSSCIMIKLAAQLNFTYETKNNKTATGLYNIPTDAKVDDSYCDNNNTQLIQISWGPANAKHSMLLQFDMKNKTAEMTMIRIILPLLSERFPDAKENQTIQLLHRGSDFIAPNKMSYHCTRAQQFNLTETFMDTEYIGTVTVHDVQTEAFRADNKTGFSNARDCDSSETSDIVPIAVGIALTALIVIVLISYLCARRRSTSRGYMSF